MKTPPPPGRFVSIGTHRLHLHCLGAGSPPVVFDAALGGSSLSWTLVQPAVAAFTTACAYDRAGFGWSDAGPLPRTAGRIAAELHELLTAAAIEPPYVVVGHSFGGLTIRAYASSHPGNVAGLVFVDPAHPEEWREPSAADRDQLQRGVALCRRGALAARFGVAALVARLASAGALDLARGIAAAVSRRTLRRPDEQILAPVTKLPMEVRAVLRWMWTQPRYFQALGSQIEHVRASAAAIDLGPDYGSLPLITISANEITGERRRLHEALARRSSRGRHVAASNSGHWIPIDEPQTVVDAIRDVVMAVRSSEPHQLGNTGRGDFSLGPPDFPG
jgi:pimeloyl-ACP methyl ester carboxylesterase